MNKRKTYLIWSIRILVFVLFILSGVAKLVPVWAFEKQLVDLNLFDWCQAPYFARFIIALEIAIGIALLQNHFIKRLVIPGTILLLVAFCIHLGIQIYQFGAMNGNCGCFGQLIPMTPLEALIKNIITIALLVYLYKNVTEKTPSKWMVPALLFLVSEATIFLLFPFKSCSSDEIAAPVVMQEETSEQEDTVNLGEAVKDTVAFTTRDTVQKTKQKKDTISSEKKEIQPKKVRSKFSVFTSFENKKVNLDEGKKIVCLFAAGCDHCRETAKEICKLTQQKNFPEVYVLFMDEETFLIEEFFKIAECRFPYQVIDIPQFWNVLGIGKTTPGVFFLWNGNIIKSYDGIDKNKFNQEEFQKIIESK